MATGELDAGVTLRWTSIPSRGGVEILLVASCCGKRGINLLHEITMDILEFSFGFLGRLF